MLYVLTIVAPLALKTMPVIRTCEGYGVPTSELGIPVSGSKAGTTSIPPVCGVTSPGTNVPFCSTFKVPHGDGAFSAACTIALEMKKANSAFPRSPESQGTSLLDVVGPAEM